MGRPRSAHSIKTNSKTTHWDKPKEGTRLRRIYDLLITGAAFKATGPNGIFVKGQWTSAKQSLEIFYGLEIETKTGPRGYVRCVGIWDNDVLIPIERVNQNDL
jgi:hypothetical protein